MLGEELLHKTFRKYSLPGGKEVEGHLLIELHNLIYVISLFKYVSTRVDKLELCSWLFNKHLIAQTPKRYRANTIFIDVTLLIKALDAEAIVLDFTRTKVDKNEKNLEMVFDNMRSFLID